MVPAAEMDHVLRELLNHIEHDDIIIDGGNSYYRDDIRRAENPSHKRAEGTTAPPQ